MIAGIVSLLQTMQNSPVGNRVYLIRAQTNSPLPYITLHRVGGQNKQTTDNVYWSRTRLQIDVWGPDYQSADALRELVKDTLEGSTGTTLSDGSNLENAQLIQDVDYDEHEALAFRLTTEFYLYG